MRWYLSDRFDTRALPLADRHYNRQKPGSPQFVPPGRCLVLLTKGATALWTTSWPFAEYTKHAWAGAWVNSLFRNERPDLHLSSDLIREAVAATRWFYPDTPALGMVTFVDADKTRRKRDPGRCYTRAGFQRPPCPYCGGYEVGIGPMCGVCLDGKARTMGGLVALQLLPANMPAAEPPMGAQLEVA